ncbi:MAG TPA: PEP-CTERM sorting domain-containing protein, partial [Pirellula sp.]|nr:PEP-CTERM sorting domain-containing protein [Pirellula sp.]
RDTFRNDLGGGTTAGANGSFGGLRREINWDGVAATVSAPNALPANFFNSTSPRGVVFSTPGTGFQVSGATTDVGAGQPALANFGNINANYMNTFGTFSAQRLFTAIGSNVTDINFFVAGTNTPAFVSGFGAVFTDVDSGTSSRLQVFDTNNVSLGIFNIAAGTVASQSLSFLGVSFNAGERIGRVQITSGNAALGAAAVDGGATDLVVMDDFLYSEPIAVPEPSSVLMGIAGLAAIMARRKFKSKIS